MSQQSRIMVFGVFDGLHKGHQYFLDTIQKFGELTIVVARNSSVKKIKNHLPVSTLARRITVIKKAYPNARVIAGDTTIGSWKVVRSEKPEIIALGYDQKALGQELKKFIANHKLKIAIKTIKSHKPKIYHSRILNKLYPKR